MKEGDRTRIGRRNCRSQLQRKHTKKIVIVWFCFGVTYRLPSALFFRRLSWIYTTWQPVKPSRDGNTCFSMKKNKKNNSKSKIKERGKGGKESSSRVFVCLLVFLFFENCNLSYAPCYVGPEK